MANRRFVVFVMTLCLACWAGCAGSARAAKSIGHEMLYATGEGAIPNSSEQPNRAKAYLEAKSYAKMQAVANLVQVARGTLIELASVGKNYAADTQIKQQINGILDGVQTVAVSKRSVGKDIIIAVTVRAPKPLPIKPRPAEKVCPQTAKNCPSWATVTEAKTPRNKAANGYTSAIIDAQGLKVTRSMSPKLLRPDGSEIWGTVRCDHEFVTDYGVVAYAHDRAEAIASKRAGEKPLMIRAVSRGDSPSQGDVVLSAVDTAALEDADRQSKFLDDFRVIIIIDQPAPLLRSAIGNR